MTSMEVAKSTTLPPLPSVPAPKKHVPTHEEKIEAIRRVETGESKASVARKFGVPESTLRGWCKNKDRIINQAQRSPTNSDGSGGEPRRRRPRAEEPYNLSMRKSHQIATKSEMEVARTIANLGVVNHEAPVNGGVAAGAQEGNSELQASRARHYGSPYVAVYGYGPQKPTSTGFHGSHKPTISNAFYGHHVTTQEPEPQPQNNNPIANYESLNQWWQYLGVLASLPATSSAESAATLFWQWYQSTIAAIASKPILYQQLTKPREVEITEQPPISRPSPTPRNSLDNNLNGGSSNNQVKNSESKNTTRAILDGVLGYNNNEQAKDPAVPEPSNPSVLDNTPANDSSNLEDSTEDLRVGFKFGEVFLQWLSTTSNPFVRARVTAVHIKSFEAVMDKLKECLTLTDAKEAKTKVSRK